MEQSCLQNGRGSYHDGGGDDGGSNDGSGDGDDGHGGDGDSIHHGNGYGDDVLVKMITLMISLPRIGTTLTQSTLSSLLY